MFSVRATRDQLHLVHARAIRGAGLEKWWQLKIPIRVCINVNNESTTIVGLIDLCRCGKLLKGRDNIK